MCPSPKGWCHASRARGVGCCRKFFVEPCTLSGHGSVNFCACALTLNFAAGTWFHVRAAVFAPYRTQVRGLSGLARVLPRRNGIVQAVVGAWALAVELSGFVGAVSFAL